jgi:hypothetical protein
MFHCPACLSANPDWSVIRDDDPAQAAKTRRDVLARASDDGSLILGAHMAVKGPARVGKAGQGFRLRVMREEA